jgi:hypothetical protein
VLLENRTYMWESISAVGRRRGTDNERRRKVVRAADEDVDREIDWSVDQARGKDVDQAIDQGSFLQNSISAENFSDKKIFSLKIVTNFYQKQHLYIYKLIWVLYVDNNLGF